MKFPLSLTTSLAGHIIKNKVRNTGKFPLVLMLEPLHACNLTCSGCGRIREYPDTRARMSLEQCLAAAEECGAPVVSVCGGEPLLYKEIGPLCAGLAEQKRHIYLCTNGVLLTKRLKELRPSNRLFINVHLDGLAHTHDVIVERKGTFDAAIEGIKAAKAAGFIVCTNTTVYRETDMGDIEKLYEMLRGFGVDGFLVSPGYEYSAVADPDLFLTRAAIHEKFANVDALSKRFPMMNSAIYLEFLQGRHPDMPCAAWANPTVNPSGWRSPCYLVADRHYPSYRDMIDQTDWERYGQGKDPRCENCMMHCGYEVSAALCLNCSPRDVAKQIAGMF